MSGHSRCDACGMQHSRKVHELRAGGALTRCPRCRHVRLLDHASSAEADEYAGVDWESYRRAIEPERYGAADRLIASLFALGARGPMLDVGCSFGWLLEAASKAGLDAFGIDPSPSVVERAVARGLRVRCGHFPEESWDQRSWGIVTYMDVLEHIDDLDAVVTATLECLRPGGFLAVQVPVTTGVVFSTSLMLERVTGGLVDGPLRRMLQMNFPYPHQHYFGHRSLTALVERFGLRVVHRAFLPIAGGNFTDRVAFHAQPKAGQRLAAVGLRLLVAAGRMSGRNDILQLIAQRR